jgi:hypothetical protein
MRIVFLSLLMFISVSTFGITAFVQKGTITKVDVRNKSLKFDAPRIEKKDKDIVGTEIIFFDLNTKNPSVYKDYLKIKEDYTKSYENEDSLILQKMGVERYMNYYIINKETNKFIFVETQIFDSDFSNTIYWGDLQE